MNKLTPENYFARGTRALTHSKIKDFVTCPNYFYRKHILNEIEESTSDAFIFGTIVDRLVSGEDFSTKYRIVDRRTAKLKEEAADCGETLILQSQYDEIIEVADAIEQTEAFAHIKRFATTQDILQVEMDINEHFDSLAGRPDWWWIDGDTCYIVDLKTSKTVDPRQYYYHALGYGYDTQLANYRLLLKTLNPQIKEFRCFNLVAAKQKDVYRVELFEFTQFQLDQAEAKLQIWISELCVEKEYKRYNPTFERPVEFGKYGEDAQTTSSSDSEFSLE